MESVGAKTCLGEDLRWGLKELAHLLLAEGTLMQGLTNHMNHLLQTEAQLLLKVWKSPEFSPFKTFRFCNYLKKSIDYLFKVISFDINNLKTQYDITPNKNIYIKIY